MANRFTGWRDGGKTNEEGLSRWFKQMFTGGPMASLSTAWQVVQRGAGANMSVDVSIGDGFIPKSEYGFPNWNDAAINVTISTADGSNPRIDVIVAYVDLAVVSSATSNNPDALKFLAVAGTPAGSPTVPSDGTIQSAVGSGNPFKKLANVAVAAAASSIVTANISDKRTPVAGQFPLKAPVSSSKTAAYTVAPGDFGGLVRCDVSGGTFAVTLPDAALYTGQWVAVMKTDSSSTGLTFATTSSQTFNGLATLPTLSKMFDCIVFFSDGSNWISAPGTVPAASSQRAVFGADFVESGLVPPTSANLTAITTAGVAWIGGNRIVLPATSKTYTASKDTYVDVTPAGAYVYTEVSNGAAAPALTAGNLRIAKVVSSGSAVTSVASGQTANMVSNFDSLGNRLRRPSPSERILGVSEKTSTTTAASETDVSIPCIAIVPAGVAIKVIAESRSFGINTSSDQSATITLYEGAVGATKLRDGFVAPGGAIRQEAPAHIERTYVPSSGGSKTYNLSLTGAGGVSAKLGATSDGPTTIKVELG